MEQFKKDLITTGRPSFIPALILGIIAIISAVTGIAFEFSRYDNFDPTHKGLAQLNAIYLMGPFAEETTNGKVTARYYIAEDTNGYLCVISTNKILLTAMTFTLSHHRHLKVTELKYLQSLLPT